jgi:hypothetical protein
VKQKDATFTFSSSEPNFISECKLDAAAFSACVAEKVHRTGQRLPLERMAEALKGEP